MVDLNDSAVHARLNAIRRGDMSAAAELFGEMIADSVGVVVGENDGKNETGYLQELIDDANLKWKRYGGRHRVAVVGTVTGAPKLKSGVALASPGYGLGIIKAPAGYQGNVIETEGFPDLMGADSAAARASAVYDFSVHNVKIDGNRGQITALADEKFGNALAIFGRHFLVDKCGGKDIVGDGLITDYVSGTYGVSPFDGRVDGWTVDVAGRRGYINNISDLHCDNVNLRSCSQLGDGLFEAAYMKRATHWGSRLNVWRGGQQTAKHSYSVRFGPSASTGALRCVLETASIANLLCEADMLRLDVTSYNCFGNAHAIITGNKNRLLLLCETGAIGNADSYGVILGDTGLAARTNIIEILGDGMKLGMIYFRNSGGTNKVTGRTYATPGSIPYDGAAAGSDTVDLIQDAAAQADQWVVEKAPQRSTNFVAFGTNASTATLIRISHAKLTANDTSGNNGVKLQNPAELKSGTPGDFKIPNLGSSPWSGMLYDFTNVDPEGTAIWIYPHTDGKFVGLSANQGVQLAAGKRILIKNVGFDWSYVLSA